GDSFNHAPAVTSGTGYNFTSTAPKLMVGKIPKAIVQQQPNNGAAFYRVCFEADVPFTDRDGNLQTPDPITGLAGPALLPDCNDAASNPPSVQSITTPNAGDVLITLLLPGDDRQRWR